MNSMLHTVAVVLTILLFFWKPRCALAAVCYEKFSGQLYSKADDATKEFFPIKDMTCNLGVHYMPPKYKKDPEIYIDNEEIGPYPLD